MKDKVICVVVTYNRKELLLECLEAVSNQTYPCDVIIIDNASTDGTRETLKDKGYLDKEGTRYIRLKKNTGGAGGFYEGIRQAQKTGCDWIWLMDDDTIPDPDCLEKLCIAKDKVKKRTSSEPAYFASTVYGPEGEYMNVPVISSKNATGGYAYWYRFLGEGIVGIEMATFVSVMINSKAVEKCGLPCRDFFIWGDDSEYTYRLSKFFGDAYFVGDSRAVHKRKIQGQLYIETETDDRRIEMYRYKFRNRVVMERYYWKDINPFWELIKDSIMAMGLLKTPKGIKKARSVIGGRLEGLIRYRSFKRYIDGQIAKKSSS